MSIIGENQNREADKTKRTVFAVAGLVALLLVAGLVVYLVTRPVPQPAAGPEDQKLEGGVRAGSPDFQKASEFVKVEEEDAWVSDSVAGGKQLDLVGTVRNFTGRTIGGLEMKGSVVDLDGKLIKERTMIVIPSGGLTELENNKVAKVKVSLTGFNKQEDRDKIEAGSAKTKLELTAVKFK